MYSIYIYIHTHTLYTCIFTSITHTYVHVNVITCFILNDREVRTLVEALGATWVAGKALSAGAVVYHRIWSRVAGASTRVYVSER